MATLTITTTASQDARIVVAFGAELGLRDAQGVIRNATAAEVKAAVIAYITQVVLEREKTAARVSAEAAVTPIAPT